MASERAPQRAFFGVSALLFAASAAATIGWCASMSAAGEMRMPGGWTMSMAWMRMPGQTWPITAASFLVMWVVMMMAMMLPSLVPMLWRYREAVGRAGATRLGLLTALVGVGYFFIWTTFGMAAFPLGVALAAIEMQQPALARAVPIAVGVAVLIAGSLQLTAWLELPTLRPVTGAACRHKDTGLRQDSFSPRISVNSARAVSAFIPRTSRALPFVTGWRPCHRTRGMSAARE